MLTSPTQILTTIIEKCIRLMHTVEILKKVVVILLLVIIMLVLTFSLRMQQKQVDTVRKEQELVGKIGDMQKALKDKTGLNVTPGMVSGSDKVYVLEGVMKRADGDFALINGTVYKDGSLIDEYAVWEITVDTVVLRNKKTKLKRILHLREAIPATPAVSVKK